jgi:hypothetical protein
MTEKGFIDYARNTEKEVVGIWIGDDFFNTDTDDVDSFLLSPVVKAYYSVNKPFIKRIIHTHRRPCKKGTELKNLYPIIETVVIDQ